MDTFKSIKAYFAIHKMDQIAILVLINLFLFKPFFIDFYKSYFVDNQTFEVSEQFIAFKANYENKKMIRTKSTFAKETNKPPSRKPNKRQGIDFELFSFNPNKITEDNWKRLGLNKFAFANMKRYLEKGGQFNTKNDLKKIYGLENDFERIKAYIDLPDKIEPHRLTKKQYSRNSAPTLAQKLKMFNPNLLTKAEWQETGLSNFAIQNILAYRNKGGSFKVKEDLKKIYGIEKDYERIKTYIELPDSISKPKYKTYITEYQTIKKHNQRADFDMILDVEINAASKEDLIKLPGIGNVLSQRILKFRDMLGGFYKIDQVEEVYGIDSISFKQIKPHLKIDTKKLIKIDLNQSTEEELQKHAYINSGLARHLIKFRKTKGRFKSVSDLRESYLMNESLYNKISPYFEIRE